MPTISSLVNPSAGKVFSGIAGASAGGQEFGTELLSGFRQGFGAAFNAGAALSQTMLGGFLSPLGQSGQAITRAAGAITNAVGGVFDTLLSGATSLAGLGGKVTSLLGGALLAGIGGAVGLIGGPMGAMIGATVGAMLGGILGKALGAVGQFFGQIVSTAGEALGKVAGLLGELGSSLVSLLGDVLKTAEDTGRSILKLQGAGYSAQQAGSLVQTVKFFGIDPSKLADKWSQPGESLSLGSRAAAMNLPRPDLDFAGFITKFTADFEAAVKAGSQSAAMFKAKAKAAGFGEFLPTAELGSKRVATMNKVAKAFQIDGGKAGELGGDVAMANNILSGLSTQLKLVFAETLLPLLPLISQGFSYIVQNKDAIAGAIQMAGSWLVNDLPPMVMRGAAGVLEAIGGLLSGFSAFTGRLAENVPGLLGFIDSLINGLTAFGASIAGTVAFVTQGISNMATAIQNSGIPALLKRINDATGGNALKIAGGAALGIGAIGLYKKLTGGGKGGDCCCDGSGKGGSGGGSRARRVVSTVGRAARTAARFVARNAGPAARFIGQGVVNLAGNAWRAVSAIPVGAGASPTTAGLRAAARFPVVAAGIAVGTAGYELMRKKNVLGYASMPSTAQILGHYLGPGSPPAPPSGKSKSPSKGAATSTTNAAIAPTTPSTPPAQGTSPFAPLLPQAGRSATDAYHEASAAVFRMVPKSNLAGDPKLVDWTQKHLQGASDAAASGANTANDWAKVLNSKADDWPKLMVKELQKLNATTEKNGAQKGGLDAGNPSAAGLAQIGAFIAQDASRLSARG